MSDSIAVFVSGRKLARAENIKAVYKAYDGPKIFRKNSPTKMDFENADVIVTDEFPYSIWPNKSIMVTHGIPLTKMYGMDMPKSWVIPNNISYIIAPSKDATSIMARQGGVSEDRVLPFGIPRFDAYKDKVKGDGSTFLATKKTYLYMPTFRDESIGEGMLPPVDYDYIDQTLRDDELFAIKTHMRTREMCLKKTYKHIIEIDNNYMSTPFLIDCDVLITDYSSILFDGYALKKPIILFEKDSERYLNKRGMYFDYPYGYASRHCRSEDELIEFCRSSNHRTDLDERCREFFVGSCDGKSTSRVVKMISEFNTRWA